MNFTRALFAKGFTVIAQTSGQRGFLTVTTAAKRSLFCNYRKVLAVPKNLTQYRSVHENTVSPIQIKKRVTRKKRNEEEDLAAQGFFNVTAFSTAEQYDLEALVVGLEEQNLYAAKKFFSTDNLGAEQDVLYVTAKYMVNGEARDIFFFREGSVVMWNFNELEANNVLSFLKPYEKDGYLKVLVKGESEIMPYTYIPEPIEIAEDTQPSKTQALFKNGKFFLSKGDQTFLEKYTFSNAMATSIKLGIWEATLERYIEGMEYLTEDLKKGRRIKIDRAQALRMTGELFALRHMINLSSDLLDTPDFYWDREQLETLYIQVCSYFSINRRTKVMNEKINHCVELAELISHNLNDKHHIRLEWMIIILIMVEVGFEILHHMERHYQSNEPQAMVPVAH
ncbi:required for meiotic nuclear division protein 1 homolog [Eupeodes corollae]|uniref:required for meiotic nuclear division protein 1 homolog n=1 Tax=Eupeodes corollae TaxID=290404 RepID=UPI0024926765|nr:required for meiotic nuclear division protein 1 homolog [Eupeodes corollae]